MGSDEPFSVIILAGGLGRRLGGEKAGWPLLGKPLLHWTAEALAATSDDLVVVTRAGQAAPAPPAGIVWREAVDTRPDCGPLAGLEAGLPAIRHDLSVAVACDMPLMEPALVRAIAAACDGVDAAVPLIEGRKQPLLAAYRRAALAAVTETLDAGERAMRAILPRVRHTLLEAPALEALDPGLRSFTNVNGPKDLTRVEALLASRDRR